MPCVCAVFGEFGRCCERFGCHACHGIFRLKKRQGRSQERRETELHERTLLITHVWPVPKSRPPAGAAMMKHICNRMGVEVLLPVHDHSWHVCPTPNFIKDMAQQQLRYETIFSEQAEVVRADAPKLEAAMAQIQQSPLVAKCGQRWEPTQALRAVLLARQN